MDDIQRRRALEILRENIVAKIREADRDKQARIREVTSSASFDPLTQRMDPGVADLIEQQRSLISQVELIDQMLKFWADVPAPDPDTLP